ncbi:MAG: SIR2 family protein [Porticoccaceae bacterium]
MLIPTDDLKAIADAVARGEYSLLLGAGASSGGTGGDQKPIPMAADLANQLIDEFSLPTERGSASLYEAYDAAGRRSSITGLSRDDYLKLRFTKCTPPEWLRQLPQFVWHRIWTLNIDDTLQVAYKTTMSPRQELVGFNWIDRHTDSHGSLQAVQLHGSALRPDLLIFSILQYVRATTARHAWHRIFGDHMSQQPFIIVGARLTDEIDLAEILAEGTTVRDNVGLPSLIVLKDVAPLARERLEASGLQVIQSTAQNFFAELLPYVQQAEARLAGTFGLQEASLNPCARVFLSQFVELRLDAKPPLHRTDFYSGFDPAWFDILDSLDARFHQTDEIVTSVNVASNAATSAQQIELLYGPMGTGKTTMMLRVARDLIARRCTPYIFRGDTVVDVEAARYWLQRLPKSVLLFDGIADHATALNSLLDAGAKDGFNVNIVATERERRLRQILSAISPVYIGDRRLRHVSQLPDTDIFSLVRKLKEKTRLGKITRESTYRQNGYFMKDCRRLLWVGMANLEGGAGFIHRLTSAFAELHTLSRDVVHAVAIAYQFGYSLPVGVIVTATGMKPTVLIREMQAGQLAEWLRPTRQGIALKHRFVATTLIERTLDSTERYRQTLAVATALAPLVDIGAIRLRTIPYRIVRNLLDAGTAGDLLGELATSWYRELESGYGWNARYWEQRALTHVSVDDLPAARSFAERALDILKDPFTMTTLGGVLLRQATKTQTISRVPAMELYWEGVELLRQARASSVTHGDHPVTVFVNQTLAFCKSLPDDSPIPSALVSTMESWLSSFEATPAFGYSFNARWCSEARKEWIELLVKHSAS